MGSRTAEHKSRRNGGPIPEIDVLWVTAGLGCDGDTIAMTAATQPSIEDIVLGGIPWIPKVNFHNPFLALANGDEFLKPFHQAAKGKLGPFILVIEGSIPDETNKKEGYWASMGTDPITGQPILTCEWIDRLAPAPGRLSQPAPAPPMAVFMPCREIRPAPWAWLIISGGSGSRVPAFRSCVFPAVPCSRTT